MSLYRCASVPSFVSLGQKITSSEDPTFKKLYPSATCRLCRSSPVTRTDTHVDYRSANFESHPFTGWACSLVCNFFARVGTLSRGTYHSTIVTIFFPPFPRVEWCLTGHDRPSRSCSRCQNAWTDRHTDTHTNITGPPFFSDPPEEAFDHNTFNAKALKLLFSTILN